MFSGKNTRYNLWTLQNRHADSLQKVWGDNAKEHAVVKREVDDFLHDCYRKAGWEMFWRRPVRWLLSPLGPGVVGLGLALFGRAPFLALLTIGIIPVAVGKSGFEKFVCRNQIDEHGNFDSDARGSRRIYERAERRAKAEYQRRYDGLKPTA